MKLVHNEMYLLRNPKVNPTSVSLAINLYDQGKTVYWLRYVGIADSQWVKIHDQGSNQSPARFNNETNGVDAETLTKLHRVFYL